MVIAFSVLLTAVPPASAEVPPAPPWGLEANPHDDGVLLTWNAPVSNGSADIQFYVVYRSEDGGASEAIAQVETEAYLDPVEGGEEVYTYLVTAVSDAGESAPSATFMGGGDNGLGYPHCLPVYIGPTPPQLKVGCLFPPPPLPGGINFLWNVIPCEDPVELQTGPCDHFQ